MISSPHKPPFNELPAVLETPQLASFGEEIVLAVPALLVYTTGAELLIMCRSRKERNRGMNDVSDTAAVLDRSIRVNGVAVELLGGQHYEYGFTYRAWTLFRPDEGSDLIFSFSWPEVPTATARIEADQLADAVRRVVTLWPQT